MDDEWLANYRTEWAADRGITLTANEAVICNELINSDDPKAPYELEQRYRRGEIRPEVAGLLAVDIWTSKNDRQRQNEITDYAVWRAMFRHRGFHPRQLPGRTAEPLAGALSRQHRSREDWDRLVTRSESGAGTVTLLNAANWENVA